MIQSFTRNKMISFRINEYFFCIKSPILIICFHIFHIVFIIERGFQFWYTEKVNPKSDKSFPFA